MILTINTNERLYYLADTLGNYVFCNISDLQEAYSEMTTFKPPFIYEFTPASKFKRVNKETLIERLEANYLDTSFLTN